ncbi:MAG: Aspartate-semialdehyde dehydrogenase [Chlamydiales bacterium]|nr:Aspartate-semialdehyde dehydrogenase [Chlamydiales bacterium]MCH9635985.1 Aspartate-semialdehyde dehydrogenase [Chlamydiales bacterium]MCH9704305.1 aspartate-semialdehyde dehydrogenase [Chlamydiota bacterium]
MEVGLLGGSGRIAKTYRQLLEDHPWFDLAFIASRQGPSLGELPDTPLLFSSLPSSLKEWELFYVERGYTVISSSSAWRLDPRVPLIIPEINFAIPDQPWKGTLIAKPNCSIQSFLLPLGVLHPHFAVTKIHVTTMQAKSGAGQPNPLFDENVIPFIENEESKNENEPCKILNAKIEISAQCNRVSIEHGHLASCSVQFDTKPSLEQMVEIWNSFETLNLPTAPSKLFELKEVPQPRFDLQPMQIQIGRLRSCPLLDWRFVGLSHNTIRGGAGGGLLIAEKLKEEGHFG